MPTPLPRRARWQQTHRGLATKRISGGFWAGLNLGASEPRQTACPGEKPVCQCVTCAQLSRRTFRARSPGAGVRVCSAPGTTPEKGTRSFPCPFFLNHKSGGRPGTNRQNRNETTHCGEPGWCASWSAGRLGDCGTGVFETCHWLETLAHPGATTPRRKDATRHWGPRCRCDRDVGETN